MRFVDLSAPIAPDPADWPDALRTEIEYADHATGAQEIEQMFGLSPDLLRNGEGWAVETFTRFGTHNSTHVDAPRHYNSTIAGKPARAIDELPLDWFHRPGVVLDVTSAADGEAISPEGLQTALRRAGHSLQPRDIVLLRTGRDALYNSLTYLGVGPAVSPAATRWLYDQGIRVMGIDAWGWDGPLWMQAETAAREQRPGIFWAAHQADLEYSQIERLCNLQALPPTGFTVSCFPLRIAGGSAAPARVVALIP